MAGDRLSAGSARGRVRATRAHRAVFASRLMIYLSYSEASERELRVQRAPCTLPPSPATRAHPPTWVHPTGATHVPAPLSYQSRSHRRTCVQTC